MAGTYIRKTDRTVVDKVIDSITTDIVEGRLHPGDKLPTEMELCEKYQAGRNSVREAIKQLQANGVVYIKRAEGTFVSESYSQKLLDPMLYSIILKQNSWQDFVELRSAIDIGILHVIINKPDTEKLFPKLHELMDGMEKELRREHPDENAVMELDTSFHSLIAEASGNPQLKTIMAYITRLTIPSRRETLRDVIQNKETDKFVALHRQWLEVLENRQVERIDQTVLDHYVFWKG
ncbi:MAG: FadR family transcriptional regulator [Lachnospiraceae bacterium]|nr:FadR family transcriptional regulator [Lachnospiraceae bacterium]